MTEKFIHSNDGILETALGLNKRNDLVARIFEIYKVDGLWRGMEHETVSPYNTIRGFSIAHNLRGKNAHFIIVSHDIDASYDVALKFAASLAEGKFSYRRVSFDEINKFSYTAKSNRKGSKR